MIEITANSTALLLQFMKMSKAEQKQFLQKALSGSDNAVWRVGSGVPEGTADKSKQSLKNNSDLDISTEEVARNAAAIREAVEAADDGDEDLLKGMAALVIRSVDAKSGFFDDLKNILGKYGGYFNLSDDDKEIAEALWQEMLALEAEIAMAEQERDLLRMELEAKLKAQEAREQREQARWASRKPKRSRVEEDLEATDNEDANFNEEKYKHSTTTMSSYLDRIERDAAFVKK